MRPLLLLLAACGGDPAPDTIPSSGTTTPCIEGCCHIPFECPPTLLTSVDVADRTVPVDATLLATAASNNLGMSCSANEYSFDVGGVSGTTVPVDRKGSLSFTPDEPLPPATSFDVGVSLQTLCCAPMCCWECEGTIAAGFSTEPPVPDAAIDRRAWRLELSRVRWSMPEDHDEVAALLPFRDLHLQAGPVPGGATAFDVAAAGATAVPGVPDCGSRASGTADWSANPMLRFEGDVLLVAEGLDAPVPIEGFSLVAHVSADGSTLERIALSGRVATEPFADGAACSAGVLSPMRPTCEPCVSSPSGECLRFEGSLDLAGASVGLDFCGP